MIVADVIHLAGKGEVTIGIVSSDDDIWPGMLSAMQIGANIIHIQPGNFRQTSPYLQTGKGKYYPVGL
jgi:hypothetical protein